MTKAKVCIIGRREFNFKGRNGEDVQGYMYDALLPDGKGVSFSSDHGEYEPVQTFSFDENKATEVNLVAKIFQNQVKYREAKDE